MGHGSIQSLERVLCEPSGSTEKQVSQVTCDPGNTQRRTAVQGTARNRTERSLGTLFGTERIFWNGTVFQFGMERGGAERLLLGPDRNGMERSG